MNSSQEFIVAYKADAFNSLENLELQRRVSQGIKLAKAEF